MRRRSKVLVSSGDTEETRNLQPITAMSHERFEDCIEACHQCMEACEHCATECLHEQDVKMMTRCIELDRSCADICSFAMREMARGSRFAEKVCALCAEVCEAC